MISLVSQVLDISNSRVELNSQACQKWSDGPSSLCRAFPVNLRRADPNESLWYTEHSFNEREDTFFKFLMLQCPGKSRNTSHQFVESVTCKVCDGMWHMSHVSKVFNFYTTFVKNHTCIMLVWNYEKCVQDDQGGHILLCIHSRIIILATAK